MGSLFSVWVPRQFTKGKNSFSTDGAGITGYPHAKG